MFIQPWHLKQLQGIIDPKIEVLKSDSPNKFLCLKPYLSTITKNLLLLPICLCN